MLPADTTSLADVKTVADIVEIGVKIVAFIIGGAWAIYGFHVFRQREAAVTALRKSESEAASLELQAKRRAVLDITISHQSCKDLTTDGFVVTVQVVLSNMGVSSAYIRFDPEDPPIRIHPITFDDAGSMVFPGPSLPLTIRNTSDPTKLAKSRVIRAGGTSRLTSVVRVQAAGVYVISFRVPMDAANAQAMVEAGASATGSPHWSATSIVCIGFPSPNGQSEGELDSSPPASA